MWMELQRACEPPALPLLRVHFEKPEADLPGSLAIKLPSSEPKIGEHAVNFSFTCPHRLQGVQRDLEACGVGWEMFGC